MHDLTIRGAIDAILRGQIRIPAFQRGFVWEPNRVAFLMDSIHKRYPFGSLLFWRTRTPLQTERQLGPFTLPERQPDYPIDYVLDGQQRITSIFGVFQTELKPTPSVDWISVYFDFTANPDAQETQFFALEDKDVDPTKHFPLRSLFDTVDYRKATKELPEQAATKIDEMQAVFKELRLPIQSLETEDRATVAIVFERVNRSGVPLDTLQLLCAWTWSEEFALHEKFDDLAAELKPFGFAGLGEDKDLLLRCCAAILNGDAAPTSLINLNGAVVRARFNEVENGVKGAIDFLRAELGVHSLDNLPFSTILVPLSVFFAVAGNHHANYTDGQKKVIIKWFWRTCYSRRYSSGVLKNLKIDIEEMLKLKTNTSSNLGDFSASIPKGIFTNDTFRVGNVNTKTFILMLAQKRPKSFITGTDISLSNVLRECNRNEFHHIYPRAFLLRNDPSNNTHSCLANFCFLSRSDNSQISDEAPSVYRSKMPSDINLVLDSSFCPPSMFDDNFEGFLSARSALLEAEANRLIL